MVLIIPPAGLVTNWNRELRNLFTLTSTVLRSPDALVGNPFVGSDSDLVIVSVDTLAGDRMFARLAEPDVEPYDLVVFDEAHKLAAREDPDGHIRKTDWLDTPGVADTKWAMPYVVRSHSNLDGAFAEKYSNIVGGLSSGPELVGASP